MLRSFPVAAVFVLALICASGCGQNNPNDAPVLAYDNGQPDPPLPPDAGESNPASEQGVSSMGSGAAISYAPSQADLERDTLSNHSWQFSRSSVDGWQGWSGYRTFSGNGTYVDGNGDAGTWLLRSNGELLMSGANGDMYLANLSGANASGQADRDGVTTTFQMYQ